MTIMDCVFCTIIASASARFLYSDEYAVSFLDIQPLQRGHALVVTRRHVRNLLEEPSALSDIVPAIEATTKMLKDKLGCDGMNLLSSAEPIAGQEVMHLHVHLIPRYEGTAPGFAGLLQAERERRDNDDVLESVYKQLTA